MRRELVVIGTSWGGLAALQSLLPHVPGDLAAPVVVAQHRGPDSLSHAMIGLVQAYTTLGVREADDKDSLAPGQLYLAPPDYHLLVQPGTLHLSVEEQVRYSRPSIDVLFETAAEAYGERTVGVVLTGANADGALGLQAIQEQGGYTIVQDPAEAERPEMPAAALAQIEPDTVARLEEIGPLLGELCGRKMADVT
jgi:two-component system, chemotaxis family, protein-glutamate methylesterase/glutaminase